MFHVYMISDSSGDTVGNIVKACLGQFPSIEAEQHVFSLVRTDNQLLDINKIIIEKSKTDSVIIFYSIVNINLESLLLEDMKKAKISAISVLHEGLAGFSKFFNLQPENRPGTQHLMDKDYFHRIRAMEFALTHDDGQATWNLHEAEIVIIGLSRTSKTPTCMYIANKGIKVANIPFVKEVPLPEYIRKENREKKQFVVGLVSNINSLIAIRQSRLEALNSEKYSNDYTDPIAVREEITLARGFFKENNIKIIDVTHRSIEEISAYILTEYENFKNDLTK